MQLTFFILVLCSLTKHSAPDSPPAWRRSRYIIDNRRNALFLKKPSPALLRHDEPSTFRFGHESFRQKLFPVERYHKDLTAEASVSEPKFYENSLPGKIVKSYKIDLPKALGVFETRKNTSGVLDSHNFIQNDDDVVTTTEKVLTWVPKANENVLVSESSTVANLPNTDKNRKFDFEIPTTVSNHWELSKPEEGNQIGAGNEKHVYETRIETVSYHQEVIFNPPNKQNWYREREQVRESYERPEENYEEPEQNYEEPEKNYELDEAMNVMSEGRIRPPGNKDNQKKFGYVVEGTNYRKYRVEERTADGFIVGEYGVVSHDDGSLRGVRYTADGSTNPKLIYETLIKFLSL